MAIHRFLPLPVLLAVAGAACQEGAPPAPTVPPGATESWLPAGAGLDLESGVVAVGAGDLFVDALGNLSARDELAATGPVQGVDEITTLPTAGWLPAVGGVAGRGYVVKSDQSTPFAVFVVTLDADGATLHWMPLTPTAWRRLEVTGFGAGFGVVSSDPPGILDCDAEVDPWLCAEPFAPGTVVSLTASPQHRTVGDCPADSMRSYFAGWAPEAVPGMTPPPPICASAADNPCALTLAEDTFAWADFERTVDLYLPDPANNVTRHGGVTHDLGVEALSCDGTFCTYRLPYGTEVTLTAVPEEGHSFVSWASGQPSLACANFTMIIETYPCAGTSPTCTFFAGAKLAEHGTAVLWGGGESVGANFY